MEAEEGEDEGTDEELNSDDVEGVDSEEEALMAKVQEIKKKQKTKAVPEPEISSEEESEAEELAAMADESEDDEEEEEDSEEQDLMALLNKSRQQK